MESRRQRREKLQSHAQIRGGGDYCLGYVSHRADRGNHLKNRLDSDLEKKESLFIRGVIPAEFEPSTSSLVVSRLR
jgi:hypothetical protein